MNLVSNSSFCLVLELEFELGVDNWCLALEFQSQYYHVKYLLWLIVFSGAIFTLT